LTSPRFATFARRATILFVTAWAVRSLIVSGDAVLNEHFGSALRTSPWVAQAAAGDGFEQSLVQIRATLPAGDSVAVVWPNAPDYYYAYFWSTFWLYPRKVSVYTSLDPTQLTGVNAVVLVGAPDQPAPDLAGFRPGVAYTFPDHVVTTYQRNV
jgi:hypothetical protein